MYLLIDPALGHPQHLADLLDGEQSRALAVRMHPRNAFVKGSLERVVDLKSKTAQLLCGDDARCQVLLHPLCGHPARIFHLLFVLANGYGGNYPVFRIEYVVRQESLGLLNEGDEPLEDQFDYLGARVGIYSVASYCCVHFVHPSQSVARLKKVIILRLAAVRYIPYASADYRVSPSVSWGGNPTSSGKEPAPLHRFNTGECRGIPLCSAVRYQLYTNDEVYVKRIPKPPPECQGGCPLP